MVAMDIRARVSASLRTRSLAAAVVLSNAVGLATGCAQLDQLSRDRPPAQPMAESPGQWTTEYMPGHSYYGRNRYIEYVAGNLPIIISVAHGGYLRPLEIPDRTWGVFVQDRYTLELSRVISKAFYDRTSKYPHIVINHLHRKKLDANRGIEEAAHHPLSRISWEEYYDYIRIAKQAVVTTYGRGFYIDLHGHGHKIERIELGYKVKAIDLNRPNAALDANPEYEKNSSIRAISETSPLSFSELLRGPQSLGSLYENAGYPAVPSMRQPSPANDPYWHGEYFSACDTEGKPALLMRRDGAGAGPVLQPRSSAPRHVGRSRVGNQGKVCGVVMELNHRGIRDSDASRRKFAEATIAILGTYLGAHYDIDLHL